MTDKGKKKKKKRRITWKANGKEIRIDSLYYLALMVATYCDKEKVAITIEEL